MNEHVQNKCGTVSNRPPHLAPCGEVIDLFWIFNPVGSTPNRHLHRKTHCLSGRPKLHKLVSLFFHHDCVLCRFHNAFACSWNYGTGCNNIYTECVVMLCIGITMFPFCNIQSWIPRSPSSFVAIHLDTQLSHSCFYHIPHSHILCTIDHPYPIYHSNG